MTAPSTAQVRTMQQSFLQAYLRAFQRIEGWFSYDAALLFMAYNQLNAAHGIIGDVLEIGVYHGLSAIAVAHLRGPARRMIAIDMFETAIPGKAYGPGLNYRKKFEQNMKEFHGSPEASLDFVDIVSGASGALRASDYPKTFSFCHVDGGHTPQETFADLDFASQILVPGGLLALDDYFNPHNPGVVEGAIEFMYKRALPGMGGAIRPVAVGYNKVLFQRLPAAFDLNAEFLKTFSYVPRLDSNPMWGAPIHLFGAPFRDFFDLYASTPERFVRLGAAGTRAQFLPRHTKLSASPGGAVFLPVTVKNTSQEAFPKGKGALSLSYHLLSASGEIVRHENERWALKPSLAPGEQVEVDLRIEAPLAKGRYRVEIDLVWDGVMWFKDTASPTVIVNLEVK